MKHDTEDKQWWVQLGAELEMQFVQSVAPRIALSAIINPDKSADPYAPDLRIDFDEKIADLKTQNTPFFTAEKHYGMDPRFTVTFNRKDFERYSKDYPEIHVIYWVDWKTTAKIIRHTNYSIEYLAGVWRCKFDDIRKYVQKGAPLHKYQNRADDCQGNAKDSYLLDLRWMNRIWSIGE